MGEQREKPGASKSAAAPRKNQHQRATGDQQPGITPGPLTPQAALALQRAAGNRVVARLVNGGEETNTETLPTAHEVLRDAGRPLGESLKSEMEARLGADFSNVRLHTGPAAERSATEIGARAYTSGSHVVIGAGGGDKHTLAHELTHVIQQSQGPVAGTDNGAGLQLSDPADRFEREAESTATRAMSQALPRTAGNPSVVESDE
jgi:hypothetical protein